jgi:hypothetical protein
LALESGKSHCRTLDRIRTSRHPWYRELTGVIGDGGPKFLRWSAKSNLSARYRLTSLVLDRTPH